MISNDSQVIKADGFVCQACNHHYIRRDLTVHHIIPRQEGGGDNAENKITLCLDCHNRIECEIEEQGEYLTRTQIRFRYTDEHYPPSKPASQDWHKVVYGGAQLQYATPYKSIDWFEKLEKEIHMEVLREQKKPKRARGVTP